jgi:hypothetical protein
VGLISWLVPLGRTKRRRSAVSPLEGLNVNHHRLPAQVAILAQERGVHGDFVIVRHGRTDAERNGNSTYPRKGLTSALACRPASVIPQKARGRKLPGLFIRSSTKPSFCRAYKTFRH